VRAWPAILVVPGDVALGTTDARAREFSRADALAAALLDFAVAAIDEPAPDSQRIFFHYFTERDRAIDALRADFPDLHVSAIEVPDEDWAERSQANLKAVHVGKIVVAPPWDTEAGRLEPGTTAIVILPSMGFGTGHHATTRLCLAALQRVNVGGRSVIDVGTGSGVLAIAASLLGATPVIGIDDDLDAIQSARENLELNPAARVDLRVGDLRTATLGIADVVLANLTGTLLVQAASHLRPLLAPNGRLVLSGLMHHEAADVQAAFRDLAVLDRTDEDEWVCLVLAHPSTFQ
jgi:ribosomal protein L11 methyltransferase